METSVIIAIIIALVGFFLGHKQGSGDKAPPPPSGADKSKEIMNDHAEEVTKAGDNYARAMALSSAARVRDILSKFRKRTDK